MKNFLKRLVRFSSLVKILTIIALVCLLLAYLAPFVHPASFRLIPFFGLAYPVILVINLLFLVIWSVARSKYALFILVALLCGGKLHFRLLAFGSKEAIPQEVEKVWKISSYNVRLFDLYNWYTNKAENKRLEIFAFLERENPDVICFQEFYHQDRPTPFPTRDTLLKIMHMKDYHERYSHKLDGRQNFGIAMLSKYPMIARGDVIFDNEDKETDNYCIYADIVKNGDTLRIYNIHLQSIKLRKDDYSVFDPNEKSDVSKPSAIRAIYDKLSFAYPRRAEQAETVMKHASESPYPVVICGDFNDTPLSYVYNCFGSTLTDAFRISGRGIGSTYVGKVPAGRIDYIFYSPSLHSTNFEIQREALSDHRAISCLIWK